MSKKKATKRKKRLEEGYPLKDPKTGRKRTTKLPPKTSSKHYNPTKKLSKKARKRLTGAAFKRGK